MKHRWASALALGTALVTGTLVAATTAPATAGPPYKYTSYHDLAPSLWELVSFDCSGTPDDGTALKLAHFDVRSRGFGSLRVKSDASYGGALLRSDRPGLASLVYPTYALGDDPHGIWRVEVGDHVLVSDPVALDTGAWTMAAIDGVILHEGDWSGTATDFQDQFGVADTYTAGLMTGGCLNSGTAYVDTVTRQRDHKIVRDLEPSVWASIAWSAPDGTPAYGDRLRLRTRLVRENLTGDHVYGIVSAHMELWRRYLHAPWKKVTTVWSDGLGKAEATVVARRSASFQWRRADGTAVSAKVLIRTAATSAR
jgi:hypothetical protein